MIAITPDSRSDYERGWDEGYRIALAKRPNDDLEGAFNEGFAKGVKEGRRQVLAEQRDHGEQ